MTSSFRRLVLAPTLALAFALPVVAAPACAHADAKEMPAKAPGKSLYERLGGVEAIVAVIHDFIGNVAADKRINQRFANADIPRLEKLLVEQVCMATGGPCKYTGRSMPDAHRGMKISGDEFTALVEDLVKSLDKYKVGDTEKKELLGALGGMKGDIVGK
jgi:hemoglobin